MGMRIAVLAWGSLVWDSGELKVARLKDGQIDWHFDGPALPLEFSRISEDSRLTLVVDQSQGTDCITLWALTTEPTIDAAAEDLRARERTSTRRIGRAHRDGASADGSTEAVIEKWLRVHGLDAAIWTALPPNFQEQKGEKFSFEAALEHLTGLSGAAAEAAREYIVRAPAQTRTAFRVWLQETHGLP